MSVSFEIKLYAVLSWLHAYPWDIQKNSIGNLLVLVILQGHTSKFWEISTLVEKLYTVFLFQSPRPLQSSLLSWLIKKNVIQKS